MRFFFLKKWSDKEFYLPRAAFLSQAAMTASIIAARTALCSKVRTFDGASAGAAYLIFKLVWVLAGGQHHLGCPQKGLRGKAHRIGAGKPQATPPSAMASSTK